GAARGLVRSAHDCSEGGLAVAAAEAAIGGPYAEAGLGAELDLRGYAPGVADEALLYGEDGARAVVSCRAGDLEALLALAREHGVPALAAGTVGAPDGELAIVTDAARYAWPVARLRAVHDQGIPRRMRAPGE